MRDNELSEFLTWQEDLGTDDLIAAFRAIRALDQIRFELALRDEGFLERVEALSSEGK